MAGTNRRNRIVDENTGGGMYTSFRKPSESNSLKGSPRNTLVLNGSPRRCIFFKVFTLEADACRRLLFPVTLPIRESDGGIYVGPETRRKLDNLDQASPTPNILFKVGLEKEKMIHMPDFRSSGKAYAISSSSRENVVRQPRKKNKHRKSVKNFPTTCQQHNFVSNICSCAICDGSNLVIRSTLSNSNVMIDKPMKRNLKKKTKKKGKQYKRLLHWKGSVGSGNVCEGSVCDVSVCESSIINNSSSPEVISEDVLSEKPTSYNLPVKVFSMENDDSDDHSSGAVKNSAATVKYIPSTDVIDGSETDVIDGSEQMTALSDDFVREDTGCNETGIDECSTNITIYSRAQKTSERAVSTSGWSTYAGNLCDMSLYSSSGRNNSLILDTVLDSGNRDNAECRGADVEMQVCIDKGVLSKYAECGMVCNTQQDIAPQCATSSSSIANSEESNDFQTYDPCCSEDPVLTDSIADRTRCSSEACSSSSSIGFPPVKRGRNSRKMSGNFSGVNKFGNANTYLRTRKEVNHSVWQRVRKNTDEENIYELQYPDSLSLQHDSVSQVTESGLEDEASSWMGQTGNQEHCRDSCLNEVSGDSVSMRMMKNAGGMTKHLSKFNRKLINKIPEMVKMDAILVPKQGRNHFSRKGPQNSKNDLAQSVKNNKVYAVGLSSIPDADSQLWANKNLHGNEMTPTVNISAMVHNVGSYTAQNDINLLAKTLDSLDMKCPLDANCHSTGAKLDENARHGACHLTDKRSAGCKIDNGGFYADHSKQDNHLLPLLQKWVPVGKRDEGRSKLNSSESVDCQSSELDGVTGKSHCSRHHMSEGHVSSNFHVTQVGGDRSCFSFETDLDKINLVVKEAYKLQIASETFQQAHGGPLAEFERLLYSASPVLGQMYSIQSCKSCSKDQCFGDTLCRHQIPNISLQNLWQWYEKPGNYGLEVKVEDHLNPKRLGNDEFDFRAYFVPYLSAIQLFGTSASCRCPDNCVTDGRIDKEHEADNLLKHSSHLSNLPIFSLLVPRPRNETSVQVHDSSSSTYSKDEACSYSDSKTCLMSQELLFEYFEADQPQLRRPLLEKMKELVKGSSFLNSQTFGEPLKLEQMKLHDLHPASWFSVAWYPIYRIPDGNFRAAFLTYHSLGHFTHRSASLKSADMVSHIVSPVVGLQSYNAKGECWLRQRGSQTAAVQTVGLSTLMPSEILKERLRTLETTASVMARASVPKGDQTSVNRQPDYEFFLSRRS